MKRPSFFLYLVSVILAVFLGGSKSLAVWEGEWCVKDPFPDYAPSGVPDFDQHQNEQWGKPDPEWKWTWDGPVAWANSIWWMDSGLESYFNPFAVPPPTISDSFPLIYSPDPAYDDHDGQNVPNVIGELSLLFYTDGDPYCAWSGTRPMDMVGGLEWGLDQMGLGKWTHDPADPLMPYFVVGRREYPAFYEIVREVERCEDVVLLLGLYEENPVAPAGEYVRVGGHYVTVAAVNGAEKMLRICDPFLDIASPGAGDHSDAAIVSHDPYQAKDILPLGCVLVDYPWDQVATNFKGVNPSGLPDPFIAEGGGGRLTLVEHMIHLSPEWDKDVYEKPPYIDYCGMEAPPPYLGLWWGVPDFDQRQDFWGKVPGMPQEDPFNNPQNHLWRWTWCGPVALANSLWWLDSKMEEIVFPNPVPPPDESDHFPLVETYGRWDDHWQENVNPFVSDLAWRMQVDGGQDNWCQWIGTRPNDLFAAVIGYLQEKGLYAPAGSVPDPEKIYFEAELTPEPTFDDVAREVYRCQDVILLLGFYEYTDEHQYVRIGGHYVACTGVDRNGSRVFLADPYVDTWVPPALPAGKEQPLQWVDPLLHNDAKIISHDEYHVGTLSDGEFWLTDYPWSRGPEEGGNELFFMLWENFAEANPPDLPPLDILHSCEYITKVEYMLHVSPLFWFWKGLPEAHHDYAQAGVPDFSQQQEKWGKNPEAGDPNDPLNDPNEPGWKWTWCGPVAVANSLWWMDSQFETEFCPPGELVKPPSISDHFPLVRGYSGILGIDIDDHDAANIMPFVEDLAKHMKTDGGEEQWCQWEGTRVEDMVEGIKKYIAERGLEPGNPNYDFGLEVGLTKDPDLKHIAGELRRCQDVILLLGFYQLVAENGSSFYVRVGGHFVTTAGVNERERMIGLCDPWFDTVAGDNGPLVPGPGRFGIPHDPVQHANNQHNDADFVSHDIYQVGVLSDGENFLEDYPWSDVAGDPEVWQEIMRNFEGANMPGHDIVPPDIEPQYTLLTKIEYMVHVSPSTWTWKAPHHDYAQAGVPDFCQKQDALGKNDPADGAWKWTWCGPVAVANSLWWMDSQFETLLTPAGAAPVKPPAIRDSFPLVKAYPAVPAVDDHDASNVPPLLKDLAKYMKTDGEPFCSWQGTRVEDMVLGIGQYITDRGLEPGNPNYDFGFEVGLTKDPDLMRNISVELRRCQDVILLLGFYRWEAGFYTRIGGHFVTAAGVSEKESMIGVCDPWQDTVWDNGPSPPGRFGMPHDPVPHDPLQHNDADFVSHDRYQVGVLPDGENFLQDYPWSDVGDPVIRDELELNFWGVNKPVGEVDPPIEQVGIFLTKIEYMVHVSPVGGPVAVAQVTPDHAAVNQIITFDGRASYHTNPARSIVQWEWDFDGDGVYDATGPIVTHAYANCIIYHGSLRVTDDDTPPQTAESFFDVFVDVDNHPPVADADGPYAIDEGVDLILDASGSSDPDAGCGDSIVSYEWDLDDDGDYDDAAGVSPTIPWADLSGLKRHPDWNPIGLRVTDLFGVVGTDTTSIIIYVNEPVAALTAAPNPCEAGETVTFDGSGSYHKHPLHSIVSYEWDLDNDSVWDVTGQVVTHSFGATGTYDVTLQVTDDNVPAKTDQAVVTVKVLPHVPPQEIAVGLGLAGHGLFEMVDGKNYVLTHNVWRFVPWFAFTKKPVETRPALGDLDGDGNNEIVVGLGPGGHGRLALYEDRGTGYAFTGWLGIPWPAYNAYNGETWPACGDVDNDGKDEIVVGLGPGGGGWFLIFDDAGAGYALMAVRHIPPIMPVVFTAVVHNYNAAVGETRPAVGDIDGDGVDEIVIGLGPFPLEGGWFFLFDDGTGAPPFPLMGWRKLPYPAYNAANGETWPVTGDIDLDGREEMIVGLGTSPVSWGWMAFFDDTVAGGFLGWRQLPWGDYDAVNGETHPATSNLDGDASAELVVGLGARGWGFMWIADDWGTGVAPRGWYWIPWPWYAWLQGLSYPHGKALTPLSEEPPATPLRASAVRTPPEPHESLHGTISGNVSSGGSPVNGAWVTAYSETWEPTLSMMTDASGDYSLQGLVPANYYVGVSPGTNHAPEYYDNVPGIPSARGSATLVAVYAAIETTGTNFGLAAGGSISGTVTDDEAVPSPLSGAIVTAYVEGGSWEPVAQTETNGEGTYVLEGLAAGTYYLEAAAADPGYLAEYYDNVPAVESNQSLATGTALGEGEDVVGRDFALGKGGSVSGKVTDEATGNPIVGATVVLHVTSGDPLPMEEVSFTSTDPSGNYEFAGLPAGTYYVEASHPAGGYAGEYYDNVGALLMNRPLATSWRAEEGESQTGIDIALAPGGVIEGKVTEATTAQGIGRAVVTVYEEDWGAVVGQTTTDVDGNYAIGNLPTGTYHVSTDAIVITYTSEYYGGQPMTEEGRDGSTPVSVTAGRTTSGIDFVLEDRPYISGTVTDDGDPAKAIEGAVVTAYDASWQPVDSALSAADGSYEIAVEAGDYYVAAEGVGHAREYFEEQSDRGAATQVSPNAPVTGVDFTLTPVGTIQVISNVESAPFTLTDPDGNPDTDTTGSSRVWSGSGLKTGTWTISWGAVPGFISPPDDGKVLAEGEVITFFGEYTLEEYKVHVVDTTGTGAEKKLRLQWYSEVGATYQVQKTSDLLSGSWENVGPAQAGIGGMMSTEILITLLVDEDSFFRVKAY